MQQVSASSLPGTRVFGPVRTGLGIGSATIHSVRSIAFAVHIPPQLSGCDRAADAPVGGTAQHRVDPSGIHPIGQSGRRPCRIEGRQEPAPVAGRDAAPENIRKHGRHGRPTVGIAAGRDAEHGHVRTPSGSSRSIRTTRRQGLFTGHHSDRPIDRTANKRKTTPKDTVIPSSAKHRCRSVKDRASENDYDGGHYHDP